MASISRNTTIVVALLLGVSFYYYQARDLSGHSADKVKINRNLLTPTAAGKPSRPLVASHTPSSVPKGSGSSVVEQGQRIQIQTESNPFNHANEFLPEVAAKFFGVSNAREVAGLVEATTAEENNTPIAKLLESNGSDLRIQVQSTCTVQEAAAKKLKLKEELTARLKPDVDGSLIIDVILTQISATTGNFGSAPRLLVAKAVPQNVDNFRQFLFYDYTLSSNSIDTSKLSTMALKGAGESPEFYNLRQYAVNGIPKYFNKFFSFENGQIGSSVTP